jgi:hypothetical protein
MSNRTKYLSYKYAFDQMKRATEAGYFLEVVMIAESIISDRLHSACWSEKDAVPNAAAKPKHVGLSTLIQRARKAGLAESDVVKLDRWRDARNGVAHALARSTPGTATMPVDEFLALASKTAEDGIRLANKVKKWQRANAPSRPKSTKEDRRYRRPSS